MKKTNVVATSKVGFVAPTEFGEHPQHAKFFLAAEEKKKTANYHKSIGKFGQINQVVYINKDGQKLVIDGWGYVQYAINNNIPEVAAVCLDLTSDEDIAQIMLELQFSDHSTPEEEYKIYAAAYDLFSKGKGYRTDQDEIEEDEPAGKKKRRPTIFDKIAAMTNANSGKRVQYILKIGSVNPLYLQRMEVEKMSLHSAYLNCTSEENKDKPKSPAVKKPVTVSTQTETPQFREPTTTADAVSQMSLDDFIAEGVEYNKGLTTDFKVKEDADNFIVCLKCKNCGENNKVVFGKQIPQPIPQHV